MYAAANPTRIKLLSRAETKKKKDYELDFKTNATRTQWFEMLGEVMYLFFKMDDESGVSRLNLSSDSSSKSSTAATYSVLGGKESMHGLSGAWPDHTGTMSLVEYRRKKLYLELREDDTLNEYDLIPYS